MRPAIRLASASVLLLAMVATAGGQEFSDTPLFAFAPAPGPDHPTGRLPEEVKDPETELGVTKEQRATVNLTLRPNRAGEFFLYVSAPPKEQEEKTYLVELRGGPGSKLVARAKVSIPPKRWVRVRLKADPPPAPPAPPVVVVPAPKGAPDQPPPEPPPPGGELARRTDDGRFGFTLRLLSEAGAPIRDAADVPYGRNVYVSVQRPRDYIAPPTGTLTQAGRLTRVAVTVRPKLNDAMRPVFTGAADLRLAFAPHSLAPGAVIRTGAYRRTLLVEPKAAAASTLTGSVENPGPDLQVHVGADGLERAFIYAPDPAAATEEGQLILNESPAVRVYPAPAFATYAASRPVPAFPVRVEADNPGPGARLELWVRPAGAGADPSVNEVIRLGGAHDERVWVDPTGPVDQGVLVTSRVKDWVVPLDLSALHGKHEVVAVMTATGEPTVRSAPLALTVDPTPPEKVVFARLPAKHQKGKPLPVKVLVEDPEETRITKATFFLGKPLDDGKLPPDAVLAEGKQSEDDPKVWAAELPLPPEKRGEVTIGVVFTNEVGLSTTAVQRVELVDAPPPAGAIDGVVIIGERPQGGLVVTLRGPDGKDLATTKTDEKAGKVGKFAFENVAPGNYSVASAKASSSYPFAGSTPVQVKVGERAKATVVMTKQVK